MDEKVIIKSVKCSKKVINTVLVASIIICALAIIIGLMINDYRFDFEYEDLGLSRFEGQYLEDRLYYSTLICAGTAIICGIIFIFALALTAIVSKVNIIVTDTRVYGTIGKKQVDIPLDSISAVSTYNKFGFKGISVSSSSGMIKFLGLGNRNEVYDEIRKLIIERQKGTAIKTEIPAEKLGNAADELKKFKELLDSGIITQEEFDAKKKQLLGL